MIIMNPLCYSIIQRQIVIQVYIIFVIMAEEFRQKGKMTVLVRMRPLTVKEQQQMQNYEEFVSNRKKNNRHKLSPSAISFLSKYHHVNIRDMIKIQSNQISVYDQQYTNFERKTRDYTFSDVFDQHIGNGHIFDKSIRDALNGLLQGYNSTILAYGITGSGKTFSVFGHPKLQKDKGLCYLASEFLLKKKKEYQREKISLHIKFSFLQIYNENVRDLLCQDGKRQITIGQDIKGNITLGEAVQIQIHSVQQLVQHISGGIQRRSSAATIYNQMSSRSHAILKMSIQIEKQNKKINSKLFIIDLAGSEKISNESSVRKNQGVNINKSLLTLGNCINALVQNSKKGLSSHIPYRDSKLTRLLKDSLGGNSKIIMIACISPYPFLFEQTITTLNYAERAKGIKKQITKNITTFYEHHCLKCQSKLYSQADIQAFHLQHTSRQRQEGNADLKGYNDNERSSMRTIECEMVERLYNDIVQNARQLQKIQRIKAIMKEPYDEYIILQKLNQQIQVNLKNTFLDLFRQNIKLRQQPQVAKSNKKKIRLSNSNRKKSKQNICSSNEKQRVSKISQSQERTRPRQQQTEHLILRESNNTFNTSSNEGYSPCLTSQRKRRSKVQIVKKPPMSNYLRRRSQEHLLFKENTQL